VKIDVYRLQGNQSEVRHYAKNTVESTTSGYCTNSLKDFDDFLLHRMGDTYMDSSVLASKKSSK
jgi:hypothetical protein